MSYTKQFWVNNDPATPLSAARLNKIETGISEAHDTADSADKALKALQKKVEALPNVDDAVAKAVAKAISEIPEKELDAEAVKEVVKQYLIDNPVAPGQVDPEAIKQAVNGYFKENPPVAGVPEGLDKKIEDAVAKYAMKDVAEVTIQTSDQDFTGTLQQALNNPAVKVVTLQSGEYQLSGTINLDKASGKVLRGAGVDVTVVKAAKNTGKQGFLSTSAGTLNGFRGQGFTLDMQWEEGEKAAAGFQITNSANVTFERVKVKNSGAHGWLFQGHGTPLGKGCESPELYFCEVDGAGLLKNPESKGASGHGIAIKDKSPNAVVDSCKIVGVSCGMGVAFIESLPAADHGAPTNFRVVNTFVRQAENIEIGYEPIGATKRCSDGALHGNMLPVSYDNGMSIGSHTIAFGNTIGRTWNHGIAASGNGNIVVNNNISNIGGENFTRLVNDKKDWAVVAFENPHSCLAMGNTYNKTIEESEAAHMVKVNVTRGYPTEQLGGNVFLFNLDLKKAITKSHIHGADRNPDNKDITGIGATGQLEGIDEKIQEKIEAYFREHPPAAGGNVSNEQIKQALTEYFRQNPPAIDDLNTAIQREVEAAIKMLMKETPSAIDRWIKPGERYWMPVTYWWADQRQPTSKWHQVFMNLDKVPFMVINPRSGPGTQVEEEFTDLVTKLHALDKPTLGYVRTVERFEQGDQPRQLRDKQTILDEIKKYVEWYKIKGAFIDEMVNGWSDSQAGMISFYKDLYHELKRTYGSEFLIVGNPGVNTKEELLECADILMSFEQNAEKYLDDEASPVYPDHYKKYPAERFWHVMHNVTDKAQLKKILDKASKSGVAYLFPTTDTFNGVLGSESEDNNPWDNLPQQWCIDMTLQWARRQDDIWKATDIISPTKDGVKNQLVRTGDDGFIHCDSGPWDNPHLANKSYVDWMVNSRSNAMIRVVPNGFSDFKHDDRNGTGSLFIILPAEEEGAVTFKWVPKEG